jgi:hypothetical protein
MIYSVSITLKIAMAIQTTRDLDSGMATLFWVACIHILIISVIDFEKTRESRESREAC